MAFLAWLYLGCWDFNSFRMLIQIKQIFKILELEQVFRSRSFKRFSSSINSVFFIFVSSKVFAQKVDFLFVGLFLFYLQPFYFIYGTHNFADLTFLYDRAFFIKGRAFFYGIVRLQKTAHLKEPLILEGRSLL